jgi:tRNA 2-thiouridine synthesizing protein A
MNYFIDVTNEHCPMTFVRIKLKIETLENEAILEIKLKGDQTLRNVSRSLGEINYSILSTIKENDQNIYRITVKKINYS